MASTFKTLSTLITSIAICCTQYVCDAQIKQPVDYVDPMIGTSNSRWMLFPGVTMPNGMVKLSPDNQGSVWQAGYDYAIGSIHGFTFIHGWTMVGLSTMPANGDLALSPGSA